MSWQVAGAQPCHTAPGKCPRSCAFSTCSSLASSGANSSRRGCGSPCFKGVQHRQNYFPPSIQMQSPGSLLLLPQPLLTSQLMFSASKEPVSLCWLYHQPEPDIPNSVLLTLVIKLFTYEAHKVIGDDPDPSLSLHCFSKLQLQRKTLYKF